MQAICAVPDLTFPIEYAMCNSDLDLSKFLLTEVQLSVLIEVGLVRVGLAGAEHL